MISELQEPSTFSKRGLSEEIESLREQLSKVEEEQALLRNALFGLARESDLSVGGPCSKCGESYTLIKHGLMSCPSCRNRTAI